MTTQTPAPAKKRGCLFYGCLTVIVLGLLTAGGLYYVFTKAWDQFITYTDTTQMELPKIDRSSERYLAVKERVMAFYEGANAKKNPVPLELTGDDLNVLIASHPGLEWFKDKFYLEIQDKFIKGKVSFPFEGINRYLNGSGSVSVTLQNGRPFIFLESLEVKGAPVPADMMSELKQQNLFDSLKLDNKSEISQFLGNLEAVEVKDGKLVLRAKAA